MSHLAAVIPEPKAPLEVQEVKTPQPGPHELLVKNELTALQPIDAKLARLALFPVNYPAILGSSFGGHVTAVGSEVTNFKVGDKVAAVKLGSVRGNQFGAFQQSVIAGDRSTSKIADSVDLDVPVGLIGNLTTVVGLLSAHAGLEKPKLDGVAPSQGKKVLIYGGSSSIGSLSVQYAAQAGYDVVTTTSPKHSAFISKLGAVKVIDHTQDSGAVTKALSTEGPYHLVVDAIATPDTIKITSEVLVAQGGKKLYALLPSFVPETLPGGVTREFASWGNALEELQHADLLTWTFGTYLPQAVAGGKLVSLPTEKVAGGIASVEKAISTLFKGVSGVKIAVNPWE